jgi:ribosomal protein S18 acetylase RimI-like enzyme
MTATPTVRRATAADLPAIGLLGAELVRVHHSFDPQRFIAATAQTAQGYGAYLGTQFTQPHAVILVASHGDDVVGYAWAGLEGFDYMALRAPAGVLYDIVVAAGQRGHGIGQRLLSAVLAELTAAGAPRMVLSTAARNASAQRLFARNGFRDTMIEMTREL